MTTIELLGTAWEWHVSIVVGCAGLAGAYLAAVRFRFDRKTVYYLSGVVLLLLTLVGPLDYLGDDYLFSAHMLEHLFLMFLVSPLLLLGIPRDLSDRLLKIPWIDRTERILGKPGLAWFIGVGTLWIWHLPVLYNAALADENIHIVEHLTMLVAATIFWWPVLAPSAGRALSSLASVGYLYSAALANTLLGVILTFAPLGAYPKYINPEGDSGVISLIRQGWGISAKADLQLGGLFMWVLGGFVFLWAIMALFIRWYNEPEADEIGSPIPQEQPTHG